MPDRLDELSALWAWFAQTQCKDYSPLYDRIAVAISGSRPVLGLIESTPSDAHFPPLLLAAVHFLLLKDPEHPLAQVYAGNSDTDPAPLFLEFCGDHHGEIVDLMTVRRIQTNDCGRSAALAPAIAWAASQVVGPYALIDVGASAGINLLCDLFRITYPGYGTTGPPSSAVEITCEIKRGHPPIGDILPTFSKRIGLDKSPVDLSDPENVRWQLACVWPGTGRMERTAASIELAINLPPTLVRGDANETIEPVVEGLDVDTTAIVITTWAFGYFSIEERKEFERHLIEASARHKICWISAEDVGVVDGFDGHEVPVYDGAQSNLLAAVLLNKGDTRREILGFVHPHGLWLDWRAS